MKGQAVVCSEVEFAYRIEATIDLHRGRIERHTLALVYRNLSLRI